MDPEPVLLQPEPVIESPIPPTKKFSPIFILAILILLLAVGAGGILLGKSLNTSQPSAQPTIAPAPTQIPTPTPDVTANWKTYTNNKYGYSFEYPPEATISEANKDYFSLSPEEVKQGITFDDVFQKYTGQICVRIEYKYGHILISAPENKDYGHVICGITGVGVFDKDEPKKDSLTIMGKAYQVMGTEFYNVGKNALFDHWEYFRFDLDDGTQIEYGSNSGDKNITFQDYLKIKPELLGIVESYQKLQ